MNNRIFRTEFFFLLILLSTNIQVFGQADKSEKLKKELIGTWEFVELRDKNNIKVDTIRHEDSYEIPMGPLLTYRADGTYTKQFTTINFDNGKWYFDDVSNAIVHLFYYEKPYDFVSKYLIDKGHAKKDKNGDYYEIITDNIIELSFNKLILLEREDRQRTFKKIKN